MAVRERLAPEGPHRRRPAAPKPFSSRPVAVVANHLILLPESELIRLKRMPARSCRTATYSLPHAIAEDTAQENTRSVTIGIGELLIFVFGGLSGLFNVDDDLTAAKSLPAVDDFRDERLLVPLFTPSSQTAFGQLRSFDSTRPSGRSGSTLAVRPIANEGPRGVDSGHHGRLAVPPEQTTKTSSQRTRVAHLLKRRSAG
jgi:hypothetical protein